MDNSPYIDQFPIFLDWSLGICDVNLPEGSSSVWSLKNPPWSSVLSGPEVDRVVIPCAASHGSMMASDEDFSSSYDYYYLGKSWLVREIIPKRP